MLWQVREGKASPVEPAALKTSRGCGRGHEGGLRTSPAGEMASYIGLPFAFRDLLTPELPRVTPNVDAQSVSTTLHIPRHFWKRVDM